MSAAIAARRLARKVLRSALWRLSLPAKQNALRDALDGDRWEDARLLLAELRDVLGDCPDLFGLEKQLPPEFQR